ncbi:glycine cleavage system aminomethyltransferase GcvT [Singulisphaera sp. PoT]|uniref:glycine cleavage system aminomethyltransferase GcvT n=1 Tax=Singulisphaera sp. PoT TaxID=3411797 RepID=UPI003BF57646
MSAEDLLKTPLHDWHQSHGGKLVDFAGWSMPVQYTSIVEEHTAVRQRVGLFDISHMGRLTFAGADSLDWLERLTTNHVAKLAPGQIQYSLMANGGGGLIDDILVYHLPHGYSVVCNASNRGAVVVQLERHREGVHATLADRTGDTAMIAVQGPKAKATLQPLFPESLDSLKYYHATMGRLFGSVDSVISRTGYTGEDGFELIVPADHAERVWTSLLESGKAHDIIPCGLGARDTLRFEAAMPLYGHELTDTINPYAAGVGWAVKLQKGDFIGRDAIAAFKANPGLTRVGIKLEGKRIARQGSIVRQGGQDIGVVTSGTFAPTLGQSLAMALVDPAAAKSDAPICVDVRGREEQAGFVALPFYRRSDS